MRPQRTFTLTSPRFGLLAGTRVWEFTGPTYGLPADDAFFTGKPHIAVTLTPEPEADKGFFTCPLSILREEFPPCP